MRNAICAILSLFVSISARAVPNWLDMSCMGSAKKTFNDYRTITPPSNPEKPLSSKDISEVIPTDMAPTQNPSDVLTKIGDRFVQKWLQSDVVKNSSMGRTAKSVENAMKAEVTVKKTKPEGTEHRFAFQFLALQALAKLEYKGWLNATVNYDAHASQTAVEVKERVWTNKDLYLNHTITTAERTDSMGVRWSW